MDSVNSKNFILAQGQVNGATVNVGKKISCSKEQISLQLTVLKQYINSFENSMKPEIYSIVNNVEAS